MGEPTKLPLMSTLQLSAVNWVEGYYHQVKKFPPDSSLQAQFPHLDLHEFHSHPTVKLAFHNRGIRRTTSQTLSDEQVAAILTIANYSDRRSISRKLTSLGIPSTRWNGWKKDKHFREFLHSQLAENSTDSLEIAMDGLLRAVEKGDVAAIKYYMELTGRSPSPNEQNFKLAVGRIVESLTRHVKDPNTLKRISQDFELIMAGQDPNLLELLPVGEELSI